jgi:DICT domain-containing protein
VNNPETDPTLSMREMSARSGVAEGTLRIWEARHNFPVPQRLPSGHRRYSELDLKRVLAVIEARARGLSLATAIEHARHLTEAPPPSVFARLRDRFAHLHPELMRKTALVNISHAIEDECCARGERPLLFGSFQRERFYRQAEPRWRQMAQTAERAIVLADFARPRRPRGAPAELPLQASDPLLREWVLVCESDGFAACLVGFEPPGPPGGPRRFETIWSAERAVVREAARGCCELIEARAPDLVTGVGDRLRDDLPSTREELRTVIELTSRIVRYAATGRDAVAQAAARAPA